MPVGADRHTRNARCLDDLLGVVPGDQGAEQSTLDFRVCRCERVGGQQLLKCAHIPAGAGSADHVLGFRGEPQRGGFVESGALLDSGAAGPGESDHGDDPTDDGDDRDESSGGQHCSQDAGASPKHGGVSLGLFGELLRVAEFGLSPLFLGVDSLVLGVSGGVEVFAHWVESLGETCCADDLLGVGKPGAGQQPGRVFSRRFATLWRSVPRRRPR